MKLYLRFPIERRGILAFDLDGTLYDNPEYIRAQEISQVKQLAKFLDVTFDEANLEIENIRKKRKESGLPPTSLGTIFRTLGASDTQVVQWRIQNIHPLEWLSEDMLLQKALSALSSTFSLALITNNPRSVAEESLIALGIKPLFNIIIGLDATHASKPDPKPFLALLEASHQPPERCFVLGDRLSVDIEPALTLGMNGILIENATEIYRLPELLIE